MGEQVLGSPRPGHGRVFVNCNRHGEWWASWQDDYPEDEVRLGEPDAGVEDFEGSEDEVIRWARTRPAEEFFVFSDEANAYLSLEPADSAELPARRSAASVFAETPQFVQATSSRAAGRSRGVNLTQDHRQPGLPISSRSRSRKPAPSGDRSPCCVRCSSSGSAIGSGGKSGAPQSTLACKGTWSHRLGYESRWLLPIG